MDIREELKSAGTYPTGPVSAWPESRHIALRKADEEKFGKPPVPPGLSTGEGEPRGYTPLHAKPGPDGMISVKASTGEMIGGALRVAGQAMRRGKVSSEVREERFATCKACPEFIPDSERCSQCGCFMAAKTWVGGNPDALCPLKKWSR